MRLPPMLLGGIAGLAIAAALLPMTRAALDDLAAARAERDGLRALDGAAPPASVIPRAQALAAPDRDAAAAALAARVRQLAGKGGVLVEEAAPTADAAGLVRVRVRLSGSEDAVIALVDALERGTPLARFASWRAEAAGSALRVQGEMVAPWG